MGRWVTQLTPLGVPGSAPGQLRQERPRTEDRLVVAVDPERRPQEIRRKPFSRKKKEMGRQGLEPLHLLILLFFFHFTLFLWSKLGLFLLFPFAFILTSAAITHIVSPWLKRTFPRCGAGLKGL